MANAKGNPDNLKPVRTKEEAKKRGAAGGKKSGVARRNKKNLKQATLAFLQLPVLDKNIEKNLKQLGVDELDMTYMSAAVAALFTKAMRGDVGAYKALMDYGGLNPDQELRDKERKARIEAIEDGGGYAGPDDDDDTEDVVIYLPDNGKEAPPDE